MTSLSNSIILSGGSGARDPALYADGEIPTQTQDDYDEPRQPRGWRAGELPSWCETWLGVE